MTTPRPEDMTRPLIPDDLIPYQYNATPYGLPITHANVNEIVRTARETIARRRLAKQEAQQPSTNKDD